MSDASIVDYGMGNLDSIKRACEEVGSVAEIVAEPEEILGAERLILPGVGSFTAAMEHISGRGFDTAIRTAVIEKQIPILGICLGMQLLATRGSEGGDTPGLDLIKGKILKMVSSNKRERIPHIGWNNVNFKDEGVIFAGIPSGTDFYFVHSYQFVCDNEANVSSIADYCNSVVSSVRHGHVFGVQFHPEKSQKPGLRLLKNFLEY